MFNDTINSMEEALRSTAMNILVQDEEYQRAIDEIAHDLFSLLNPQE